MSDSIIEKDVNIIIRKPITMYIVELFKAQGQGQGSFNNPYIINNISVKSGPSGANTRGLTTKCNIIIPTHYDLKIHLDIPSHSSFEHLEFCQARPITFLNGCMPSIYHNDSAPNDCTSGLISEAIEGYDTPEPTFKTITLHSSTLAKLKYFEFSLFFRIKTKTKTKTEQTPTWEYYKFDPMLTFDDD